MKQLYNMKQIQKRTRELAKEIHADYGDKQLVCICVLKGAVMFFVELMKNLNGMNIVMDFINLSSYSGEKNGEVRCVADIGLEIKDQDVLVVEDIIDSGASVEYLRKHFLKMGAKSIKICTMLDKINLRKNNEKVDYNGFCIEDNAFLVGFGLDYDQKYRNKNGIFVLDR